MQISINNQMGWKQWMWFSMHGFNVITRPIGYQLQRHWFILQYVCITFYATRKLNLNKLNWFSWCLIGLGFSSYASFINVNIHVWMTLVPGAHYREWTSALVTPNSRLVIWYLHEAIFIAALLLLVCFCSRIFSENSERTLWHLQIYKFLWQSRSFLLSLRTHTIYYLLRLCW
jgi:hypothetical protein